MATILLPSKWATMPSQPVELNGSNPFVQDLVFAVLGSPAMGYQDAVSGKLPTPSGAISNVIADAGRGVKLPNNGNLDYGHTLLDDITTKGTLLIRQRPNGNASNYRTLISREDTNTGDGVWLLYDDLNQATNGFNLGSNNTNYRVDSLSNALGTNSEQFIQTFGASWDGTNVNMYANATLNKTTALALPVNTNTGRTTRIQSGNVASADAYHAYAFKRALNLDEWKSLYYEPFQIYQPNPGRIYFIGTAGGGSDGTGSGSISSTSLSSPTGSALGTADGVASGSVSAITLTAPVGVSSSSATVSGGVATVQLGNVSGSASAGTGGNASGSISQVNTNAPTGVSSGWATVSSSLTTATLSSPSGTATGGTGASASGNIATVVLSNVSGSVSGDATTSGSIATCILAAPTGNASSGSSATGSGSIAQVVLGVMTASVNGYATMSGSIDNVTTSSVNGTSSGGANTSGSVPPISITAVLGTASGTSGGVVATGNIANVYVGVVNASVSASSVISSSLDSVLLVAPNGSASVGNLYVPRVVINIQAQPRLIKLQSEIRTVKIK